MMARTPGGRGQSDRHSFPRAVTVSHISYLCQHPTSGRKLINAKLEALVRQFVQMCFDTSKPTSRRDKPISRNMESSRLSNSLRERRCCHHSPRTWFS
jgi:hypothetical protein